MPAPTLKRPRTFFEHSWPWVVITAVLTAGVLALAYLGVRYLQSRDSAGGSTFLLLVVLGAIALLLALLTFVYSLRKRVLQERVGGTMMSWLKSHVWLGLLSLAAAAAHALVFPITTEITTGKITAAVLVLLVVSGALWRIVYAFVPGRVPASVGNLSVRDTRRRVEELRTELEKIRAGKSTEFQKAVDDLLAGRGKQVPDPQSLDVSEAAHWQEIRDLAERIARHSIREAKQRRFGRVMQGWKLLHLPLAAVLLGMVAVHIGDVFNLERSLADEPERRFASSSECANCHPSIVDEWKLSMHRNAQTSTITIAQTALALANSPELEKLCVNCHAPIGTKFTQKAVFTPARPDPTNPEAVEDEGVTCIVCHTMLHPPGEITGARDDLAVGERSATSYGTMFGPPLRNPGPIPVSAHDIDVGFMDNSISSSQLCGTCHNVIADVDGDGIIEQGVAALVAAGNAAVDTDGDGVLDENELDVVDGKLQDLALQTTFDEWEDYVARGGGVACVDCHMPPTTEPLVDNASLFAEQAERSRHAHYFVGVDYELNIAYYAKPGMPKDALERVLTERENLLSRSAVVAVEVGPVKDGKVTASVEIRAGEGHSFPTGFAFARQFWLEVSAKTATGKPVCLTPDPHGISSPCESGKLAAPADELPTCDPSAAGLGNKEIKLGFAAPLDKCDPWLVNFQKILTDGDPEGDGAFSEVAYQSKRADIVKLRVRTADQKTMAPITQGQSANFDYVFSLGAVTEPISVRAVLRFRHLPPYFVKALEGHYPRDITSEDLLENMTVVDVASNEPLSGPRTSPSFESLTARAEALASARASAESPGERGASWVAIPAVPTIAAFLLARRRGRRRKGATMSL